MAGGGSPKTKTASSWTPEQHTAAKNLLGYLTPKIGRYQGQLDTLMSGEPSTAVNPAITEQYFTESIYNPAMRNFENVTLPAIGESMGRNYWGTARRDAEQTARENLTSDLTSQLAKLTYADEQAGKQLKESAMDRMLNAYRYSPEMQMLSMLGYSPQETIMYQQPGLISSVLGPLL